MTATPAFAVFDLLVGENGLVDWAPPLVGFFLVGEAFLIELQEAPLGPFVVFGVGSIDFTRPVDVVAESLGLLAEVVGVGLGDCLGSGASLDGVVLGREAESIVTEGPQDVKTLLSVKTS